MRYYASCMGQTRSDSQPALPAALCVLLALAGATLMVLTQLALRLPLRVSLLVAEAALLLPAVVLLIFNGASLRRGLGLVRVDPKTAFLSIGAGITLWLTGLGILELQYLFWKPDPAYLEAFRRLFEHLRPGGPFDALGAIAVVALGPAFFEESLCRGLILPSFAGSSRFKSAVAASALHLGGVLGARDAEHADVLRRSGGQ
jgi:membrane protease YdiL (CAAX protease family)